MQRAGARQLIGAPKQEATVADIGIDCGVGGDIASILKTVRSSFTSLTQTQRALKLATYTIPHGHDRLRHQSRQLQRNAQVIHRLSTGFVTLVPCVHERAK